MTAAVCLTCGKMKTGAWTPCPGCGYAPESLEERAKQLIATDHYVKSDVLEALSKNIQSGQPAQFVDSQVQAVMEALDRIDNDPEKLRRRRFFKRLPWLLLAGAILLAALIWPWLRTS